MEELIRIHVNVISAEEVKCGDEKFCLILFDGYADGDLFSGKILPGGVDCQHFSKNGGTLSARYILDGTDFTGKHCRLFIENNADAGSDVTHPSVKTDSEALKWLQDEPISGRINFENNLITIEIGRF